MLPKENAFNVAPPFGAAHAGLNPVLEFLHLCDGKDGWREDAEREFPSLAPLGERDEIFVGASQNVQTPGAGL
jgi:hypothetical protein